jgi:hypothetical protein
MEKYVVGGVGKGKNPMREESLRIPTPILSKPIFPKKGTLFVVKLLRLGVVYSSWSALIVFP